MNTNQILILARKHLGCGTMESSARLCLRDAINLFDAGDFEASKVRALKSLQYSVGLFHPDYQKAMTTKTISLKEWNEASTEQRNEWLAQGVLVREEDRTELDKQAFPRNP